MAGDLGWGAKALRGSLPRGSKFQMPVFQKTFQAALTEHAPWRGGPGVRKLRDSAGPVWGLQLPDGGDGSHGRPGTSHVGTSWGCSGRSPGSGRRSPCFPSCLPGSGPGVAVQNRPCRTPTKRAGKGAGLWVCKHPLEESRPVDHVEGEAESLPGGASRCVLYVSWNWNSRTGKASGLVAMGL